MAILQNPKERQRFIRFAIVGAIGALVDFGVFNLLATVLGVYAVVASVVSFSLAVVSNFTWNRFWTYPDSRTKPIGQQLFTFALINVIGLGIRTPLFAFLERRLTMSAEKIGIFRNINLSPIFIGHNVALACAILVVMFWNFYANRYLTYNDVS